MLSHLLQILGWVADFFSMALLARVLMQWTRAPFRNPLGQFVVALTDWAVRPARRVIPSAYGVDLPGLLLAWLTQAIFQGIVQALVGGFSGAGPDVFPLAALTLLPSIEVLRVGIYLLIGVLILGAVFSWVNPHAPLAPTINAMTHPFLRPFRRLIPPIGGVDLSPLVLLLLLQILLGVLDSLRIHGYGLR